jgi:DNA integrity scanning protein DisA with diadenylate cyclase activity
MPLPPRPDFEAIEAAAPASSNRRTHILALIGNLVFAWANNESMFIYIMMILMETDQTSATITFGTLNTTRARLDLIQRLAKAKINDKATAKELDALIERFNDCTRIRNEFNHCIYTLNDKGEISQTQSLRIQEVKGRLQLGTVRKMDDLRIKEMVETFTDMKQLNRDIWDFLPRLEKHVRRGSATATVRSS